MTHVEQADYGFWASPLTADRLASGNVRVGFPSYTPDGSLYYVELRSAEQGRSVLMRRTPDGTLREALPASCSVRTRVHEYGGLAYLVLPDALLFVNQADQQLWIAPNGQPPRALTAAPELRFAEPIFDAARERVIAIAERHASEGPVENMLVTVALSSAHAGEVSVLASGHDFYAAPALSPSGNALAFLTWNHPQLPWDAAQLQLAQLSAAGEIDHLQALAGDPHASAFQPCWSPGGVLYFALEHAGFWNLHRYQNQRVELVAAQAAELGAPLWQLGTQLFACASEGSVVGVCFEHGLSRVVRIAADSGGVETLCSELLHIGQIALRADGQELACVLGWAGGGTQLVRLALDSRTITSERNAFEGWLDTADSAQPEAIAFPTSEGEQAYGFFYAPKNQHAVAPTNTLPPLIVMVHGGPTAGAVPVWKPDVQFWTTRGFAVLDVNYRGSTGYGRAYRDRLRGQWGVLDVDDCVYGARFLAAQSRVDARKLFIRGGSAGGYTVLQALAHHEVFAAGACHYGISDLEALVRDTHKFESHYDRFLIGPYPERRDLFLARSPIYAVERIKSPVVFFQGLEDKVVPADQTERMARTLREHGRVADYHAYAGEQHGFRQADTIRHVLTTELEFFQRVLAT
jgi:dipeptidyl aminopeptidase/acylaminoacyl peptidase